MTHRQHGRAFRRDQRAAATVEFAIVALLALVPLVLGILQLGLLYAARHTLNHAAFLAARAGAVTNGSRAEMQRYLAKGLVPLYAGAATDLDGGNVGAAVAGAYARAYADVLRPDRTRLRILNPAAASFTDFERRRAGVLEIPNAFDRQRVGQASGQTLADANLLRISVDRCEPLIVPFIDTLLTSALRRLDHDLFRQGCYAARRLPIAASALVHMHTPPRRSVMDPLA